jgi:hypothetical protein
MGHSSTGRAVALFFSTQTASEVAMLKNLMIGAAAVLGVAAVANGLYMLVSPEHWYLLVPGVTTTGPFNQHFIRDIGLIFLFVGAAFLVGAATVRYRVVLWAASTLWLAAHALFHLWEVAVGICEPSAIARDFPAVTLAAIIGAVLTLWAVHHQRASISDAGPVKNRAPFARHG